MRGYDSAHRQTQLTYLGRSSDTARSRRRTRRTTRTIGKKMMNSGDDGAANVDTMPKSTVATAVGVHFRIRDYITSLPGIIRVSLVVRK